MAAQSVKHEPSVGGLLELDSNSQDKLLKENVRFDNYLVVY